MDFIPLINEGIRWFVEFASLWIYRDILSLLTTDETNATITVLSLIIVASKIALTAIAIFSVVYKFVNAKFAIAAAVALTALIIFLSPLSNEYAEVTDVESRLSSLISAFTNSTVIVYEPSLVTFMTESVFLSPIKSSLHDLYKSSSELRETLSKGIFGISLEILYYFLVVFIFFIVYFIIKTYNKVLAIIAVLVAIFLLIELPVDLVIRASLLIVFLALVILIVDKMDRLRLFAIYPAVVAVLLALSFISLPVNVTVIILIALMSIAFIPLFYILGVFLASIGSVRHKRKGLGLKIRPTKYIEEYVEKWDPSAIAVICTILFILVISIFGATIYGIGTYSGILIGLLRK